MINEIITEIIAEIITDSEVEKRSTAETLLDLHTQSLGKIKTIEQLNIFITQFFIEMDVLHSDKNKILHEMTPPRDRADQ